MVHGKMEERLSDLRIFILLALSQLCELTTILFTAYKYCHQMQLSINKFFSLRVIHVRLVGCWSFMSLKHLRSYQDVYRFVTCARS